MRRLIFSAVLAVLCLSAPELRGQLPSEYWRGGPSQTRAISGRSDTWPMWNPIVDASTAGNSAYRVGSWDVGGEHYDDVLCFQWDLPCSLSMGAVIDTARLVIRYSTDLTFVLALTMFAPNYPISTTDRETIFYNAIHDQIDEMGQPDCSPPYPLCGKTVILDGSEGYYELWTKKSQYSAMPLTDAVQDAIDNHGSLFSLVMRATSFHLPGRLWYINPADVTLELYYHPPEPVRIDDITITNVVNGEVGYDREVESRVRGDLNLYSSGDPYTADYAQMPPFEPSRATRSWDTQRRHLAETWFTRFDDASLPRPMKFRLWDDVTDRHKVIYQTPLY